MEEKKVKDKYDIIDVNPAEWKTDRRPAPLDGAVQRMVDSRVTITIARINNWLSTGIGDSFETYYPTEYESDMPVAAKAKLEAAGFVVTFIDNTILISRPN